MTILKNQKLKLLPSGKQATLYFFRSLCSNMVLFLQCLPDPFVLFLVVTFSSNIEK